MPIGLGTQFFHHLHQMLIVTGNLKTALIKARLLRTGRSRPIRSQIGFLQRPGAPPMLSTAGRLYASNRTYQNWC